MDDRKIEHTREQLLLDKSSDLNLLFLIHTQVTTMKPQDIISEKSCLWIFGYGSLVWKPGFSYKRSKIGYIKGYKRRFWHGDDFHRGDKEKVRLLVKLATKTFIVLFDSNYLRCIWDHLSSLIINMQTFQACVFLWSTEQLVVVVIRCSESPLSVFALQPGRVVTLVADQEVSV